MRYIYIYIYTQRSNQWTDTWRGVYWIRRRGKEGKEQRGIMLRIKCNNMSRISRLELRKREKKISGEGRNDKNDSWKEKLRWPWTNLYRACPSLWWIDPISAQIRYSFQFERCLVAFDRNQFTRFLSRALLSSQRQFAIETWLIYEFMNFDVDVGDFLIGFLIITGIKLRIYDRRGS